MSKSHLAFLESTNEEDHQEGRIGYETYVRFADQASRCHECPLLDNGRQGDMYEDCRVHLLRFYISAKRDDDKRYAELYPREV